MCGTKMRGGEVAYKVKKGGATLIWELTSQVFYQNYLPILTPFGVKRVL